MKYFVKQMHRVINRYKILPHEELFCLYRSVDIIRAFRRVQQIKDSSSDAATAYPAFIDKVHLSRHE
jgi:hypothetical protein